VQNPVFKFFPLFVDRLTHLISLDVAQN